MKLVSDILEGSGVIRRVFGILNDISLRLLGISKNQLDMARECVQLRTTCGELRQQNAEIASALAAQQATNAELYTYVGSILDILKNRGTDSNFPELGFEKRKKSEDPGVN